MSALRDPIEDIANAAYNAWAGTEHLCLAGFRRERWLRVVDVVAVELGVLLERAEPMRGERNNDSDNKENGHEQ